MAIKLNPLSGQFDIVLNKAEEISYTDTGTIITANDVQGAIEQLESEIENMPTPLTYVGTWNASTNSPFLENIDADVEGYLYQVNVAGTVDFGAGNITFSVGDKVVNNGTVWERWDMVDAVESVNGFQGVVDLDSDDVDEGAANLYFTDTRARDAIIGAASSVVTSNLNSNRATVSDASGKIAASATTDTEIGYVSGVTSAIQTQLNGKQATITGAATSITSADLTASRALESDGSGKVAASAVTSTELGYVSGVTSAIQTQIDAKAATSYVDAQDTEYGNRVNRNYLEALYSGASIAGINQYADAAAAVPVDGTGGSPAGLTTALNTTTELRRASSQRLSKDAADRQGEGWSIDMTVDRQDYEGSKPLFVSFGYATSAAFASGDVRLFVYDITNATLLNVTSLNGDGSLTASPDPSKFTGVFYPVSSSASYRLIAHITSTNASAWDLDVIDLSVSPDVTVPGAIVADYGTEAWTDSEDNSTTSVKITRVGNRVLLSGRTTFTGVFAGTGFVVTIPTAYTPDATVYANRSNANGTRYAVGRTKLNDVSAGMTVNGNASLREGNNLNLYFEDDSGVGASDNNPTATLPFTWASGDYILWNAEWVVQDWQASAALSTTEALFSTAKARYSGGTQAITASGNILDASSKTYDTFNAVTTGASWKFTAPRSGYYKATCFVQYVSRTYADGNLVLLQLRKNGAFYSQGNIYELVGAWAVITSNIHSDTVYLSKGEYIDFFAINTGSTSTNTDVFAITVEEVPDFSIFSVYGQTEYRSVTSNQKTPAGNSQYHNLTNNSLTLTPGTWKLTGNVQFSNSGVTPTYAVCAAGWYAANGADSAAQPALLSSISGASTLTAQPTLCIYTEGSPSNYFGTSAPIIIQLTSSATVYFVSFSAQNTSANARIIVYANAERLQ